MIQEVSGSSTALDKDKKPGKLLLNILNLMCKSDIKGSMVTCPILYLKRKSVDRDTLGMLTNAETIPQTSTSSFFSYVHIPASRWVSKKKKVFKKAHFYRKKKFFQSEDLAIKICRQMQRYSLWSGLVTCRQFFLGFFYFLKNFYVGQDGAKWCDVPQRGGCRRAPHATGGGPGVLPREIFGKNKLWEGNFKAILKTPGKID